MGNELPKKTIDKMRFNQEKLRQENRIKEIKDALIQIGFKDEGRYFTMNGNSIKLFDDDNLSEVFKRLMDYSETKKLWEIQSVLGIN